MNIERFSGGRATPRLIVCVCLLAGALLWSTGHAQQDTAQENPAALYRELLEQSQTEKRGLTFFVAGHAIPGVVRRLIGTEAVEVYSQTYPRLIIRLRHVEAVAIH